MTSTRRVTTALASGRGMFLTALVAGGLCSVAFLGVNDGASHTVTAKFTDADGLVVGNEVRVAGVVAGAVTNVEIASDPSTGAEFAQVTFAIDADRWPLHQGTSVAVKPKGVLSNVFVDLAPGSASNPSLGDQPVLNISQTQSPVNLDQLTNVFTPSVLTSIRTQLQEGVLAFGGAGTTDLNQTIAGLNPLTLDATPLTNVLAARSPELDNLNVEFDTITADLAREDANLRPLITNLDTTLAAIATREVQLQGTLTHAASVFSDLSLALSSTTTQADLQHIFAAAPEALSCAGALSNYLNPVITAVNPYINYKAPLTLANVLADFVTASGFNGKTATGVLPPSGNTLRANNFLALPGYTSHDAGGLTLEHGGATNASSTAGGPRNVYEEQPPITSQPTLSGCSPPPGLP